MIGRFGGAVLVATAAVATAPAVAAQGRASDRALAPLVACRGIADVRARATCYDTALDKLQADVSSRQVVVMDREQVAQDRTARFGFAADSIAARPKPARRPKGAPAPAPEQIESLDSKIVQVASYNYDLWIIRIATGAVWRTIESGWSTPPEVGDEVHIRRGALGSYFIRLGNNRTGVRAVRAR